MARITCAISGIRFQCSYLEDVNISHTEGYFHPIFAVPYKSLHKLYTKHCCGELTSNDSYLLFIAFLHSSGKITWKHPASCNPNESRTKKLIENNLAQLITVLEKSAMIRHPSFTQPKFNVSYEVASLEQIPNWIQAWEENIKFFQAGVATIREQHDLMEIENKLSQLILSGESPHKYSAVIAKWASKAGNFPEDKDELWQRTIRSCFSITKMFTTPLPLLKEIKDYCESNIEAGSIHFHSLCKVLKEGISRHHDYLGGSSLATGYTLLPSMGCNVKADRKNEAELLVIASNAPASIPEAGDYPNSIEFLKAKLAYRVARNIEIKELRESLEPKDRDLDL